MEPTNVEAGSSVPAVHLTLPDCSAPWEPIFTVSPRKELGPAVWESKAGATLGENKKIILNEGYRIFPSL